MAIEDAIRAFQDDLKALDVGEVAQRRVTHGSCHALNDDQYFDLKNAVARQYGIHHTQVVVVGSAKLGFSIAPQKRYREFGEMSDIDVAFASPDLYDKFWSDTFDYWSRAGDWPNIADFRRYHFRGWIRPDKLPATQAFARSNDWWNFFQSLASTGQYGRIKITGALYKSWDFLEGYQRICLQQCKNELEL